MFVRLLTPVQNVAAPFLYPTHLCVSTNTPPPAATISIPPPTVASDRTWPGHCAIPRPPSSKRKTRLHQACRRGPSLLRRCRGCSWVLFNPASTASRSTGSGEDRSPPPGGPCRVAPALISKQTSSASSRDRHSLLQDRRSSPVERPIPASHSRSPAAALWSTSPTRCASGRGAARQARAPAAVSTVPSPGLSGSRRRQTHPSGAPRGADVKPKKPQRPIARLASDCDPPGRADPSASEPTGSCVPGRTKAS